MSASLGGLVTSDVPSVPVKKKKVLLIDTCRNKREMRSETMRRLGIEVDCAADISEARCWWRAELYDLVLFHVQTELPHMFKFWDDIRATAPSQQIAFLVGKPEYLAMSPNGGPAEHNGTSAVSAQVVEASSIQPPLNVPGNWGILEACRRISTVRSLADARLRALQNKPLPRRDTSGAEPRRPARKPAAFEQKKEELQ